MARRPRKPSPKTQPRRADQATLPTAAPHRPWTIQALFWIWMLCLAALLYGMTPYTYSLDDIKVSILFCLFPVPLVLYFFLLGRGQAPCAPRSLNITLGIYVAVMAISTALTPHKWIAWYMLGFTVASLGGLLGAIGVVRNRADLEKVILGLLVLCIGTLLFGYIHRLRFFDLLQAVVFHGNPPTYWAGADGLIHVSPIHGLIYTLAGADREMMSTILNRDFFAAYLNMTLPLALGLAVATKSAAVRRGSMLAWVAGMLAIVLTMSKNDYVIMAITPALFAVLYFVFVRSETVRLPNWHVWLIGSAVILATLLFLRWDLFADKLKLFHHEQLARNLSSRWIIWAGALAMFRDYPLLGAGPGTFRVLFPAYRSADYLINDISTVTLHAHNAWLDYLAETGILGFAAITAFQVLLGAYLLWRLAGTKDRRLRALMAGLFCGYAGIMLASLTSPFSRWPIGGGAIFAFYGVLAAAINAARFAATDDRRASWAFAPPSLTRRWSGYVLGAAMAIVLVLSMQYGARYFRASVENNTGIYYLDSDEPVLLRQGAAHFSRAIELNPTFVTSHYRLASIYHKLSRLEPGSEHAWLEESLAAYKDLARLAPDYSEIHYNFGILYGDLASLALREYEDATEESPRLAALDEAMRYLSLSAEQYAEAARQSNKLATQSASADAFDLLSDALLVQAQTASAPEAEALRAQARSLREKAAATYEKLLQYDPRRADVTPPYPEGDPGLIQTRRSLASVLARLGRNEQAAEHLHALLRQKPGDRAAVDLLEEILARMEDEQAALGILDDLLRSNPLRVQYRTSRMRLLDKLGRADEARLEARRILRLDAENSEAQALLAVENSPLRE